MKVTPATLRALESEDLALLLAAAERYEWADGHTWMLARGLATLANLLAAVSCGASVSQRWSTRDFLPRYLRPEPPGLPLDAAQLEAACEALALKHGTVVVQPAAAQEDGDEL